MAVIPGGIYRRVEAALHHRADALDAALARLREAEARATSITAPMDAERVQSSSAGDRLERGAIAVAEARDALDEAERWHDVFAALDEFFRGRDEARAAALLYGQHKTQQQAALEMHVDRQTVRRYRDAYVCHCALLAAEAGLIRMR